MNKLILTLVSTLMLTGGASALAQDDSAEPRKNRQGHHRGMPGMPVAGQMFRAFKQLDLDEGQKTELSTIMDNMKADLKPVMEATRAGHMQLKELVDSDVYDEDAVAAIAEKEGDLAAERVMITSRAMSNALKLLTDEQREELKTLAQERRERRGERRAHHRQDS